MSQTLESLGLFKGQAVVVPPFGGGVVDGIRGDEIAGEPVELVEVAFLRPGAQTLVQGIPTNKIEGRWRKPSKQRTINEAMKILCGGGPRKPAFFKYRHPHQQNGKFDELLAQGDILVNAQILREIHERSADGAQVYMEKNNKAKEALASELAIATQVGGYAEAITLIEGVLRDGKVHKDWKRFLQAKELPKPDVDPAKAGAPTNGSGATAPTKDAPTATAAPPDTPQETEAPTDDVSVLEEMASEVEGKLATALSENEELTEKLAAETARANEAAGKVADLTSQLAEMTRERDAAAAEGKRLKGELEGKTQEIAAARDEIERLRAKSEEPISEDVDEVDTSSEAEDAAKGPPVGTPHPSSPNWVRGKDGCYHPKGGWK